MSFNPMECPGLRYQKVHDFSDSVEYYSIGDVHGCAKEFEALINMIREDAANLDKVPYIICHGDMIDRGPEFFDVIDIAHNYCDVNLLGNHEHNFVLERLGKPCNSNSRKVSHDRFEKLSKPTQAKVMKFLNGLYNFAVVTIKERTFILTHAPLKNMERYYDWNQYLHIGNAPYFCMRSSVPIDEDMKKLQQDVTFVYGHQSWEYKDLEEQKNDQLERRTQYYNVDASCVYGGQLVALRLSDLGVLSVQSKVKVPK